MSDRERSPSQSASNHSGPGAHDKTPSPVRSRSRSRSVSQHRPHHRVVKSVSRSRSHSPRRKMSYRGGSGRGGAAEGGGGGGGGGAKYRSRSRSPKRYKMARYSRSRSYSPRGGGGGGGQGGGKSGYSDRRREFYRSHSRSPMSSRRRHQSSRVGGHASHQFNRDNPQPSRCLGIFGLSIYTTEQQMHHIMSKYGPVERVQVVIDAKTGRSRGFSFVYFESAEDAKVAKEQCTGMEIDGRRIRVDFSITQRAHTPTPGIYMGKPTYMSDGRGGSSGGGGDWGNDRRQKDYYGGGGGGGGGGGYRGGGGGGGYRGRSPSPYYRSKRGRYERSRSRSYSPRRY